MRRKAAAVFMMAAGTATAMGAVLYAGKGKKKKREEDKLEDSQVKSGITEEKLKEYLSRLFQIYGQGECGFEEGQERNLWEQEAGYYAELLYPYVKGHMETAFKMEGDDGYGNEPFNMTDELFYLPACRIYCEPVESVFDKFDLERGQELWMQEDGRFAVVNCMSIDKDGWKLTYRFIEGYVRGYSDIPFDFEDLETGLFRLSEEAEEKPQGL